MPPETLGLDLIGPDLIGPDLIGPDMIGPDLIDVVIRLPRAAVEDSLRRTRQVLQPTSSATRLALARAVLAGRRHRRTLFAGVRFCEPSWDMILELYVATGDGKTYKVTKLCAASGGSVTTALRHLEHLEARGYLRRQVDDADGRSALVVMQPTLCHAVDRWLDDLQHAGLAHGCAGGHDPAPCLAPLAAGM